MILTRIEVRVLCAERHVCPAVMSEMRDLGFTDVKEVFDKPDADITARLNFNDKTECDEKFESLFEKTGEKISQVSYGTS